MLQHQASACAMRGWMQVAAALICGAADTEQCKPLLLRYVHYLFNKNIRPKFKFLAYF